MGTDRKRARDRGRRKGRGMRRTVVTTPREGTVRRIRPARACLPLLGVAILLLAGRPTDGAAGERKAVALPLVGVSGSVSAPQEEKTDEPSSSRQKKNREGRYRKLPPQFPLPGWWARVLQQPRKVSLGAGFALRPRYPGASDLKLGPILFFDVEIKRKYFINVTDGIGLYFYRRDKGRDFWSPYFELKLSLAPGFESRSAKEFAGLDPVGKTVLLKLSGTLGYGALALDVSTNTDALDQGHGGSFVTFALQGKLRAFGETLVSLGPEARWGGGDYMDAFYGVDHREGARTGLPPFHPGSGFERVGGKLQVAYPLAPHWTLFSLLRYEALIGRARRSPITRSTNRVTFVFALGYRF